MPSLTIPLLLTLMLSGSDATYDGARVHYESHGRGREAVIFVHDWSCDLTFWRGQAPVYEKHRSLLIDLPGHGRSDKPDVPYTQERFARAIDAVMREAGVDRAVIVGHGMGGPVALTFLRLFPAKTKALVLADAYIPDAPADPAAAARQKTEMDAFAARWRAPGYREAATERIDSMFSAQTTPAARQEIRTKMLATPQYVMASALEGMLAIAAPKPGETYAVPVLAIASKTRRSQARLRAIFPNLRTYEGWAGTGHFLMIESPDRFNHALEEFLAGLK